MNSARRRGMKRHACNRARERWGIFLTIEDIGGLNAVVRMGLGRPIEKNSKKRGRKFFVTTLGGVQIPVVYDDKYSCVATVLAPQAAEVRRAIAKRLGKKVGFAPTHPVEASSREDERGDRK